MDWESNTDSVTYNNVYNKCLTLANIIVPHSPQNLVTLGWVHSFI